MQKRFTVTPYRGFEREVLRLRNQTRSRQRDRAYLDWRYLGQESGREPMIFWVYADGRPVGMAGGIFRPYLVAAQRRLVLVIGDISLLPEFRGTGLVDELFQFVNSQIRARGIDCALVIPNVPARKVLERNGWQKGEDLVHHVLYLRPWQRFSAMIPVQPLARLAGLFYLAWIRIHLAGINLNGYALRRTTGYGDEFNRFWERYRKEGLCMKEMTADFLAWRYGQHPDAAESFLTYTCHRGDDLVGYLVCRPDSAEPVCTICDILAIDPASCLALLKLVIREMRTRPDMEALRFVLNAHNRVAALLRRAGFSPRQEETLFQLFFAQGDAASLPASCSWYVSSGDKDV